MNACFCFGMCTCFFWMLGGNASHSAYIYSSGSEFILDTVECSGKGGMEMGEISYSPGTDIQQLLAAVGRCRMCG